MIYDIAIVGGGIVGLAATRELALRFPGLAIANVEKEDVFNAHQTGRNSGVIHSGIYYKPGSFKAKLCVEGRKLAWDYCDAKGIEYKQVGKLIVATEEGELGRLDDLWERGQQNGVEGLEMLDAGGIREREPHCRGIKAIFSPVTGIVDWARVSRSFAHDAKTAGVDFFLGHDVTSIARHGGVTVLATPKGEVRAKHVITCGGLYSDKLAKMTGGARDPKIVPFRGDYLILKPEKRGLVRGNIYPVPDPEFPFLGVHFTPRMNGDVWLGPNAVLAFAREGYSFFDVNPPELWDALTYPGFFKLATKYWRIGAGEMYRDLVRGAYVGALRRYIPELEPDDCLPGPAGVRAQAMAADGSLVDDFVFEGADGIVHVRNAPSPAATSSLAIGNHIADDAERRFDLRRNAAWTPAFVEIDWVHAHRDDANVRVVDARSMPHGAHVAGALTGAEQYAAGHVPGAVHLDYAHDLADPATPYATRVAPAEAFARTLGEHGIGDGTTVVAYDDGDVPYAARFLWMCRYYGHDAVAIMAGGFKAWRAAGYPVTAARPSYPRATFTPHTRPALRATREDVLAIARGASEAQLLETQRDKTYAMRDRDIAGARRLSGNALLEDANGGRVAAPERLRQLVDDAGLDRSKRTIVTCGSGVSASGSYVALLEAGFTDLAVYDGSWLEWDHDGLPTVPKDGYTVTFAGGCPALSPPSMPTI